MQSCSYFGPIAITAIFAFAGGVAWLAIHYAKDKTHAHKIIDWANKAFKK